MRLKYEKVIHHAVVNNLFGLRYMKKSYNAQGSSKYYLFVTASLFISFTLCLLRIVNGTIERVANMVGVSICLISWTTASMPN